MEGAHSDDMADGYVCYICVRATRGKDGDRERGVQGCIGEDWWS